MKIILIILTTISLLICSEDNELVFGTKPDQYFVITLPSKNNSSCFPQQYVPVQLKDGRLDFSTIDITQRKLWLSEGLVGFTYNQKSGYSNENGEIIIPAKFDSMHIGLRPYVSGLAVVQVGNNYHYANKEGVLIAGPFEW